MKALAEPMRDYFYTGETLDINFRIKQLKLLKKVLLENDEKIIQALNDDLGKSSFESVMTETGIVQEEINYYIKNIKKLAKPKKVKVPLTLMPGRSEIYNDPYGVVLIISPWNYPFFLTMAPLIAAIAAGNCAVLKLSEYMNKMNKNIQVEWMNEVYRWKFETAEL